MSALGVIGLAFAFLTILFLVLARSALRKRRPLTTLTRTLLAALFASLALLCALVTLGTRGYRALTVEEVAATVRVTPIAAHHFAAAFTFPDGRQATYDLRGDQLYVDARVLKWRYWADLLGLHTLYALDRVGGRYGDLNDELNRPRTLYALGPEKPLDLFDWIRRYTVLAPLADADYGSGTFLDISAPATLQVRVSTTGLLIRAAP